MNVTTIVALGVFAGLGCAAVVDAAPIPVAQCDSAQRQAPATAPSPCTLSFIDYSANGEQFQVSAGPDATSVSHISAAGLDTQATTSFNHNGVFVDTNGIRFGFDARSEWLDTFTILGGVGDGTMTVDWALDGTLSVYGFGSPCSFTTVRASLKEVGAFGSAIVDSPSLDTCDPATRSKTVQDSGSFTVAFTYGTPFVGGLQLEGRAGIGTVNFLNTGKITDFILPDGASIFAASGTIYPTDTTPVPEPASLLLVGTGIVGSAVKRWRKGRAIAERAR